MAWECIAVGHGIDDVKKDRRTIKHVEKYGISEQAIYFEGQYLPLSLITDIRVQPSIYYPKHSCGKGLPVFKIRLDYGAEKPLVLMMEKEKNAALAVSMIQGVNAEAKIGNHL